MRRAFSLVELSIVLVILGLLVGGVLSGQSLIRGAELRAVTEEYQRYTTAIGAFRDKYFALPGDMPNATAFWGAETSSNCAWNSTTSSSGSPTCNGDGNGTISPNYTTPSGEMYRAWQHLARAGLIEGSYTGLCYGCSPVGGGGSLGVNIPKSKISNAGWSLWGMGNIPISDTTFFDGNYANVLMLGTVISYSSYSGLTMGSVLKPEEAWNIDTKLDDGKPATGKITSYESISGSGNTTCSDLGASSTVSLAQAVYRLDNTGLNCALIFKTGF